MKRSLIVGALVLGSAAACGKSPQQKAAEETAAAAQQAAQSAQQGVAQMMQGLGQMAQGAQGAQGGQPVAVVDYEKLKELLPQFPGWEQQDAKGSQNSAMGFSVSTAEANYKKGESNMKLEIIDTSMNQMLLAPIMMIGANFSERSDNGYKKGTTIGGFPGFEEWQKDSKKGEVHVIVGSRFIVHVEGYDVDSTDPPKALAQAVNLSKLAGLK